ncbi:MAG: YolD-like family protein [Paenibacillus sp.]|uniref:YolD-like protein n=1 Tax=Paenibacillus aquistagni TaxID=1852522 RepID=A0A1X7IKX7_9BACL|nr:YolD-like family protein [Paenibacillus aquistagni]MBR2569266.1 YolD-like family protein [Paenibacillus sp.]NMM51337.1 YolD-like family protein [Paenibacillus aquistagni]SMG15007.1 YolD-like protein [Paenibacillus aquistagni]
MSKKLEGNGLFESSRMMLPEHKEAFLHHQERIIKQERPKLDTQELEYLSMMIAHSMQEQAPIVLTLFDEIENKQVTGTIIQIDPARRAVRLQQSEEKRWIPAADIIQASSQR